MQLDALWQVGLSHLLPAADPI